MSDIEMIPPSESAVAVTRQQSVAVANSPSAIMALAIQQGAPVETIERMWALQVAYEEREAKKAFTAAMAMFKRNAPTITKDKHVAFTTQKGTTEYDHATLGNVVKTITAGLAEQDISISWDTRQVEARVIVTCTLTHKAGHSEGVTLEAAKDDSGGKNNIQSLGSAISYLQRYTLLAITGLATEGMDDDGASTGRHGSSEQKRQLTVDELNVYIKDIDEAATVGALKKAYLDAVAAATALNDLEAVKEFGLARDAKTAKARAAKATAATPATEGA